MHVQSVQSYCFCSLNMQNLWRFRCRRVLDLKLPFYAVMTAKRFQTLYFELGGITKHLMTGPSGNSEFCFPSSLNVSLGFASGNIEVSGKQNSLFPLGPFIKCLLSTLLIKPNFCILLPHRRSTTVSLETTPSFLCINGAQIWITILYTSLASHSREKSFVLKHKHEAKDVYIIVIQIWAPFMQRVYCIVWPTFPRLFAWVKTKSRGTQREYSSKPLKHSIVKRILVFKR